MTLVQYYYAGIFVVSFLLTVIYIFKWHKHFDVHMTVIFVMFPIADLAYLYMYLNNQLETAIFALQIIYLCACYLMWLTTMCVMTLCKIRVGRRIRITSFLLNSVLFGFVLTIGRYPAFYKSISLVDNGSLMVLKKEYGPVHTIYYVFIILYFAVDLAVIAYSYKKKAQVSNRILLLLFIPIPISMIGYFAGHVFMELGFEIVPLTYLIAQIVYVLIAHRMVFYDVSQMVIESVTQTGDTGFITFDSKKRYLGSNDTAKSIIPELTGLSVDSSVIKEKKLEDTVIRWLDDFDKNPDAGKDLYVKSNPSGDPDEKIYTVSVSYLYDEKKRCGYHILLEDDTDNQKYIRLLDQYNSDLQDEVAAKTDRIVYMHDKLILGLATMVESRDNSTGGHIRRTSEGVRMLIEVMKKDEELHLSDDFCKKIIKAAPMHDLGKIAVDDAVLKKAGRFTDEEREKMKVHAAEGAKIVHNILRDTDDDDFRRIAENVAHYHHEWVDGNGYPDGLVGDEIPFEARIMAIADVYDALVSKRVYKDEYSFEKADSIILEGMGRQFDPKLRKYYVEARPAFEEYYSKEAKVDFNV